MPLRGCSYIPSERGNWGCSRMMRAGKGFYGDLGDWEWVLSLWRDFENCGCKVGVGARL